MMIFGEIKMRKVTLNSILKKAQEAPVIEENTLTAESITDDYIFQMTGMLGDFGISSGDSVAAAEAKFKSMQSYFLEIKDVCSTLEVELSSFKDSVIANKDMLVEKFSAAGKQIKEDVKSFSEDESLVETVSILTSIYSTIE